MGEAILLKNENVANREAWPYTSRAFGSKFKRGTG